MAEFILTVGAGMAWPNTHKKSEKAPDFNGKLRASRDIKEGEIIEFAIWSRTNSRGPYLSMKQNEPFVPDPNYRASKAVQKIEPRRTSRSVTDDDDIPF